MKTFDCLDRGLNLHANTLLEASAGTGKTFSIENLYVRLLIEEPVRIVEEILVVTFTKAATKELKSRIRKKISASLKIIKEGNGEEAPDYLAALLEKDEKEIKQARRRLEAALASFDLSKILTIHGFCERTLRDHRFVFDAESRSLNELVNPQEVLRVVKDFFRTDLASGSYSPAQVKRVKKKEFSYLERDLKKILDKGLPIEKRPSFSELFLKFRAAMIELAGKYNAQDLIDDFKTLSPYYKKPKKSDPNIEPFCLLFDKEEVDEKDFDALVKSGLGYAEWFAPLNTNKNKKQPEKFDLKCPGFVEEITEKLEPIVAEARAPEAIFCRMAHDCQNLLGQYLDAQEKYRYDDLLTLMLQRSGGSGFAESVRQQYGAVIIDEFQDTDPVQWQIFQTLFLRDPKQRGVVYLVGDPKQSIYAFRQADIYTYRAAGKELGEGHIGTLDVNWRSDASLIRALNSLFSEDNAPGFINLPKEKTALKYREVIPSPKASDREFSDEIGSVHFLIARGKRKGNENWPAKSLQQEALFPAIGNEIIRLKKTGVAYSEWAVLVKDRNQAALFFDYCEKHGIPAKLQRQKHLVDSKAYTAMKELLVSLIDPKDMSALKIVLAGPLVGWDHRKIRELEDEDKLAAVCEEMALLREKEFARLYEGFLQARFLGGCTVKEKLLTTGSMDFFYEFQQIAEQLIDYQYQNNCTLLQCLEYLAEWEALEQSEDEALKSRQNPEGDAVQILTMHISKGLEFGIVAPLGLMCRTKFKDKLITVEKESGRQLAAPLEDDELSRHLEEVDAEKMRQLYVAMTRAKHRLYVPLAIEETSNEPAKGEASPLELFMKRFNGDFVDWIFREGKSRSITCETLSDHVEAADAPEEKKDIEIVRPEPLSFSFSQEVIRSFSSLAKSHRPAESLAPHDFSCGVKNAHTLPSGRETGTLLHKILENISFDKGAQNAAGLYTRGTPFEDWSEAIGELIEKVLKTPFKIGSETLTLCAVSDEKVFRECEFLYPSKTGSGMYLKGVIDLAFEYRGRYYILDWKSNWLGPSEADYHLENLRMAMNDHDYFLQEEIYREAFRRYISLFDDRPFEECYGGAVYLFLRGIDNPETNGVYFIS
jgi:exodeoxyribonuclease V beta subunit